MAPRRSHNTMRRSHLPGAARYSPAQTTTPPAVAGDAALIRTVSAAAPTLPPTQQVSTQPIEPPKAAAAPLAETLASPPANESPAAPAAVAAAPTGASVSPPQRRMKRGLRKSKVKSATSTVPAAAPPAVAPTVVAPEVVSAVENTAVAAEAAASNASAAAADEAPPIPVEATASEGIATESAKPHLADAAPTTTAPMATPVADATKPHAAAVITVPHAKRIKPHRAKKGRMAAVMMKVPITHPSKLTAGSPTPAVTAGAASGVATPVNTATFALRPIGFTRFTKQQVQREQRMKLKMRRLEAQAAREQRRLAKAEAKAKAQAARAAAAEAALAAKLAEEAARVAAAAEIATAAAEAEVAQAQATAAAAAPIADVSEPQSAAVATATTPDAEAAPDEAPTVVLPSITTAAQAPKRRVAKPQAKRIFFDTLAQPAAEEGAGLAATVTERPPEASVTETQQLSAEANQRPRGAISPEKLKMFRSNKGRNPTRTVEIMEAASPAAAELAEEAPTAAVDVTPTPVAANVPAKPAVTEAPIEPAASATVAAAVQDPTEPATLPPKKCMRGSSYGSVQRQKRLEAQRRRFEELRASMKAAAAAGVAPAIAKPVTAVVEEVAAVAAPLAEATAPSAEVPEAVEGDLVPPAPDAAAEVEIAPAASVAENADAVPAAAAAEVLQARDTVALASGGVEAVAPKQRPTRGMSRTSMARRKRLQEQKKKFEQLRAAQAAGAAVAAPVTAAAIDAAETIRAEAKHAVADTTSDAAATKPRTLPPVSQKAMMEGEDGITATETKTEVVEAVDEVGEACEGEAVEEPVNERVAEAEETVAVSADDLVKEITAEFEAEDAAEVEEGTYAKEPMSVVGTLEEDIEGIAAARKPADELQGETAATAEACVEEKPVDAESMLKDASTPVVEAVPPVAAEAVAVEATPKRRTVASAKKSIKRHSKLAALRRRAREQAANKASAQADAAVTLPLSAPQVAAASEEAPLVDAIAAKPTPAEVAASHLPTPAETLVHNAVKKLTFPEGSVTVESFNESEMILHRASFDDPWSVGLHFDWTVRALAIDAFPKFPPTDPRSAHPYIKLFESKPNWYLKEVNGANAARLGEVMDALKRTLTARFVFKQVK